MRNKYEASPNLEQDFEVCASSKTMKRGQVTATISYHLITFAVLIPKIPWRCKSLIQISNFSFYLFFLKISISPQMAFFSSFSVIRTQVFFLQLREQASWWSIKIPLISNQEFLTSLEETREQLTFFFNSDHIFEHMVIEDQYSRVFSLVLLSSS